LDILRSFTPSVAERSLVNLEQSLSAVRDCGLDWVQRTNLEVIQPNMPFFGVQFANAPPDSTEYMVKRPWLSNSLDLVEAGSVAASHFFADKAAGTAAFESAGLAFAWLIIYLYICNRPFFWRLASADGSCQMICDHGPVVVANLKIAIPSLLLAAEFLSINRVWVGSLTRKSEFLPVCKLVGLGY
jgi:hypothetical protein